MFYLQYLEIELEPIPGPCSIQICLLHAPSEAQAYSRQLSVNKALTPAADSLSGCLQTCPRSQGPMHQRIPAAEPGPRCSQPQKSPSFSLDRMSGREGNPGKGRFANSQGTHAASTSVPVSKTLIEQHSPHPSGNGQEVASLSANSEASPFPRHSGDLI